MEGLHLLKDLLKENDYMCKIDLKDVYFCVPLHTSQRKYIRFQWEGQLYEFLCLCFGLGPAPRIFTKLMKIPISVLRRMNKRLIIYLDDILLMAQSISELNIARDSLSTIGVSNKPEEIGSDCNSNFRIFGPGGGLKDNDINLAQRKSSKVPTLDHCWRTSKPDKFSLLNSSSDITCTPSGQVSAMSVYSDYSEGSKPSIRNPLESGFNSGIGTVVQEPVTLKWEINSESGKQQDNSSDRCLQTMMGGILSRQDNRKPMDLSRVSYT